MTNDPELNGKYLGKITSDFVKVSDMLFEACYQMRKREISAYPVVTLSREELSFAPAFIPKEPQELEWYFGLSMMEALTQTGIIDKDRQEDFIANYKNPEEFCCCLVLDLDFINFVFIPYPED